MTFVAVGPAAILDICGTKPVQVATVFGIIDVILKEHLTQPVTNSKRYYLLVPCCFSYSSHYKHPLNGLFSRTDWAS